MSDKKEQTTAQQTLEDQTGKLVDAPPDLGLADPSAGPEPGLPSLSELADGLVDMNPEALMKAAADAGLETSRAQLDTFLAGRPSRPGGLDSWRDKGLDVFDVGDALAGPLGSPVSGTTVGGGFGAAGGYDPTLAAGAGKPLPQYDNEKHIRDREQKEAEKREPKMKLKEYVAPEDTPQPPREHNKNEEGKDLLDHAQDTVDFVAPPKDDPETYDTPDGGPRPVTTVDIENALAEQELQSQIHGPRTGGPQDDTGGGPLAPTGDGDQNNDGVPDNPMRPHDPTVDAPQQETFTIEQVEAAIAEQELQGQIHGPDYDPNAGPVPAATGAGQTSVGGQESSSEGGGGTPMPPPEGQVAVDVGAAPAGLEGGAPPPTIDGQSPGDFAPGLDDGEALPVGAPEGGPDDLDGDGQPG